MAKVLVGGGTFLKVPKTKAASGADSESGLIYSTVLGTSLGFIAGAANGAVLLAYVPEMTTTWTQGAVILLVSALGWAMYGAIIGGSGVLARGNSGTA